MYGKEEAFKKSADFALPRASLLSGLCLISGIILKNTVCGPELSEWNIVNGCLCGALAASLHFAVRSCPKVLQNAYRISQKDISSTELRSDGMMVAAVSAGIVVIPAILVLWSINGLSHMTIGLCAESAPLFYLFTLGSMIAQVIALAHVAKMNMEARGYNIHNIETSMKECAAKTKEVATDIGHNGYTMAMRASDRAVPAIQHAVEEGKRVYRNRPEYLRPEYWMSPEARSLLHR